MSFLNKKLLIGLIYIYLSPWSVPQKGDNKWVELTYRYYDDYRHWKSTWTAWYIKMVGLVLWCLKPLLTIFHFFDIQILITPLVSSDSSVISWQSVLLMEETGVPGENHRPAVIYSKEYLTDEYNM